jgi:hypothetical protein
MSKQQYNTNIRQEQNALQFPSRKVHKAKSINHQDQGGNKTLIQEKTTKQKSIPLASTPC